MTLTERVARAIWKSRFKNNEFDYAKWLATETEDGGNGRYLAVMADAHAAIAETLAAIREPTADLAVAMTKAAYAHPGGVINVVAIWHTGIDVIQPDAPPTGD